MLWKKEKNGCLAVLSAAKQAHLAQIGLKMLFFGWFIFIENLGFSFPSLVGEKDNPAKTQKRNSSFVSEKDGCHKWLRSVGIHRFVVVSYR